MNACQKPTWSGSPDLYCHFRVKVQYNWQRKTVAEIFGIIDEPCTMLNTDASSMERLALGVFKQSSLTHRACHAVNIALQGGSVTIRAVWWTTMCPKNIHLSIFQITVKNQPILMIFSMLNSEKIWHQQLVHSHTFQIIYVISEENKRLPLLPTTPEKCHPITL